MPSELPFPQWLSKMRELLEAGGPRAVRTFIGEHLTDAQVEEALAALGASGKLTESDPREALAGAIFKIDAYQTLLEDLGNDPMPTWRTKYRLGEAPD